MPNKELFETLRARAVNLLGKELAEAIYLNARVESIPVLRALVVESEPLLAALLAEMLTELGYACAVETSAAGAVALASLLKPNLMIVNPRLRDGDGIKAVDDILRSGPVPHVFITPDLHGVRRRRADAVVLQMPFKEPDLVQSIQRVLGAAR